jgi:hypothetical protein
MAVDRVTNQYSFNPIDYVVNLHSAENNTSSSRQALQELRHTSHSRDVHGAERQCIPGCDQGDKGIKR